MGSTRGNEDPLPDSAIGDDEESNISPRETRVLQAMQEENLTVFTFDGIKRLLGVHQESLSRILDRLEEKGLVEKVPEGYRVTPQGSDIAARPLSSELSRVPIIQSILPEDLDISRIVSGLKGRWFGSLRWLGYSQNEEGTILKWITDDNGVQVDAKFTDTFLTIEVKVGEGRQLASTVNACYQLLGFISRLYRGPRRAGNFASPVVYFGDSPVAWPVTLSYVTMS